MLIYDGDCAFCTSSAGWIEERLPEGYPVVPWQFVSDLETLGLDESDVRTAAWWIGADGVAHGGHLAIGRALIEVGGFWSLLGWLTVLPPLRWLAGPIYTLIAANRHRLPGGTPACALPTDQHGTPTPNRG